MERRPATTGSSHSELEEPPPEVDEGVLAAGAALVDEDELVSEDVLAAAGADELYKSEYQPPPLRMNPPPRDICRFASRA